MTTGSRVQVMNGTVDKTKSGLTKADLKLNPKTGRYVSKAKSEQAHKKIENNKRMKLRRQATKEVTKGRKDAKDLFKAGDTKIKRDVRERYEALLKKNNLPITTPKKKAAKKSAKKRPTKKGSTKRANRGGWFY